MRGSLHIHMLIHVLGFASPQGLLRRFRGVLPQLTKSLWDWVKSISCTSVEALPTALGLPDPVECSRRTANLALLGDADRGLRRPPA